MLELSMKKFYNLGAWSSFIPPFPHPSARASAPEHPVASHLIQDLTAYNRLPVFIYQNFNP